MRIHFGIASCAAVAIDVCHSFDRPPVAGTRTGHKNSTPVRVMAVNSVAMKHSAWSSGIALKLAMA
jgi:hypothetical protein